MTIHIFLQLILQITLSMYGFIKILTYTTNLKRGLLPLIKFLITPVKLILAYGLCGGLSQKDEVIIFVTEAKGPGVQLWKFDDVKLISFKYIQQ